ncbi:MAG: hypothetical protein PHZ00_00895 [Candidatus Peribacteraceae bacterium]|nr:hypothetical protein [Candidatus Peribacteraceae bacterium]
MQRSLMLLLPHVTPTPSVAKSMEGGLTPPPDPCGDCRGRGIGIEAFASPLSRLLADASPGEGSGERAGAQNQ